MKINKTKLRNIFFAFWPIFFIFIIWFIFSSPYFLKDKVPYPSTYQVNFFPPWNLNEKYWGPVKNNAMPDIIDQIYPWKHFTIETWKNGQIPFWNPNSFTGNPHLANFQSAVFSPFNLLFFIFNFIDAWSITVLIQPLMAAVFMYFFMRELKISRVGSLVSSICFMFSGFIVVWMAYGTLSMAISFLPLALFTIKRNFNELNLLTLTILSLSIAFSFFSGHFQTSLYFLIFVFAFFIFESYLSKKLKNTLFIFLSILFGICISLFQIIPSIQFYLSSVRSGIFINGGGIPIYYLVNIFSPDFFGNPVTRNDWFGYYAEWASFVGIVPLMLSLFSAFRKNRLISFFFIFASIVILLLCVDSPVQKLIGQLKIPVLSTSEPSRMIVLFSFSLAVLAGYGLDNLREIIQKKEFKKIFIPIFIVAILMLIIWLLILIFKVLPADKLIIAKRNLVLPSALFVISIFLIIISFIYKRLVFIVVYFLLFLVSFDSLRFAQKWMPFDPKNLVFPNLPVISAMGKNIGFGRVFGNLRAQVGTYYNLPIIEGYDPLYVGRYGEFVRSSDKGEYISGERSVVKVDRNGKYINRVLDLLGVSLIFHPLADTNRGWAFPVWKDNKRFPLIYQDDKFQLFKNTTALPRVTLFYDYEVIKDDKEIIKRFFSEDFNFREKLILEENIGKFEKGKGTSQILTYSPNYIKIKVSTNKTATLFLSDNFYPGWEAKINSIKTKIYRADYTFRAVILPPGESIVEFNYKII